MDELFRTKIGKIKNVILNENDVILEFADKKIELWYDHDQDCCENVYADFSVIEYYIKDIKDKEYKEMIIRGVGNMGFLICLYQDYEKSDKIFIPCYNEQNGYYSDNLELVIKIGEQKTIIDITEYKEDNIC